MYILTKAMRDEFIGGLSNRYARALPTKSIATKGDIMFAATHLYAYGTPFVLPLNATRQPHYDRTDIPLLNTLLEPFVTTVWKYFNESAAPSTQTDFDRVHEQLCEEFLQNIAAGGRYTHTYGNAQKMVNILFKYLACFEDSSLYADWFKYCHMALDGYTYSGGYRLPFYSKVVYPAMHNSSVDLVAWSNIENHSYYQSIVDDVISYVSTHPKTYNDYLDICARFPILTSIPRVAPKDDFVLTPFEAEFFVWVISKACQERSSSGRYTYSIRFVRSIEALL